jgi:hypothetical protein
MIADGVWSLKLLALPCMLCESVETTISENIEKLAL